MGTPLIGRGVRVEVQKTLGAAKTITALSLANPGVATSATHALADGAVGFLNAITGMVNLEGQAVRVDSPAASTFELQGIDTTTFPAFTAGTIVPVTAWATLSRSTSYDIGGGEADKIDTTVLLDDIKHNANGLLSAQNVNININHETVDEEALQIINAAALNQGYLVFRITFKDGAQRVFRGQPSLAGESVGQGALGTGTLSVTVKGSVLRLPAIS